LYYSCLIASRASAEATITLGKGHIRAGMALFGLSHQSDSITFKACLVTIVVAGCATAGIVPQPRASAPAGAERG